ncbi:unnamed protein product [Microthlaspi erraticum]|uniref:Uncharacterized protein n=1 Tax=Microthlaspi erraticum TaxID=1685480 RepID=A0A6D2IZW2_9BRAS|nr:unnamed protein product [Microthlaspi erraticum]
MVLELPQRFQFTKISLPTRVRAIPLRTQTPVFLNHDSLAIPCASGSDSDSEAGIVCSLALPCIVSDTNRKRIAVQTQKLNNISKEKNSQQSD